MKPEDSEYWPEEGHPETGEAFVSGSLTRVDTAQFVRWIPPSYPSSQVPTAFETRYWQDGEPYEEPIAWRDRTPEEMAAAIAQWEKDRVGCGMIPGPLVYDGSFKCKSGSTAAGSWMGGRWIWHQWDVRGKR